MSRLVSRRRTVEGGQALVFTLLFAAATGLICLLLFNSGMLANTKTQLQNAADAAAYSGGVLLARDHNFSAYTNRAMVANQVAVAQIVSIKSYLQDAASTQGRLSNPLHTRQAQYATVKLAWQGAKLMQQVQTANTLFATTARTSTGTIDALIGALSQAQNLHHTLTIANVVNGMEEVVVKNDRHASITKGTIFGTATFPQTTTWGNYTERHRANTAAPVADRFANVVVSDKSTDTFVRNRASTPVARWASLPNQRGCRIPRSLPIFTNYSFEHRGGTLLSANKKRWLGLDATMGSGTVYCIFTGSKIPIPNWRNLNDGRGGHGGGLAGSGGGYGNDRIGYVGNPATTRSYGGALSDRNTSTPARQRFRSGPGTSLDATGGGLQDYYRDVANTAPNSVTDQTPERNGGQVPLTIEVEHTSANIRTSSRVLGANGERIRLDDATKGNTMRTLASAHAYFYRPRTNSNRFTKANWARQDGRIEVASLFSPYWQVRMVEPTFAHKQLSQNSQ